jgi:glutathione synthase
MKIGFLIDPIHRLKEETDTSLGWMDFARKKGWQVYTFTSEDLFFSNGIRARLHSTSVFLREDGVEIQTFGFEEVLLEELDICFLRKDPPFDDHYVQILQLLSSLEDEGKVLFVNSPAGVLKASEKLYTLTLPQYIPRTLISSDQERIEEFIKELNGPVILKPVNLYGSKGIEKHMPGCSHLSEKIRISSSNGEQFIIVQEFLEEVVKGDKRVFLINGKVAGAITRIPQEGEFRCAVGLGARVALCDLSPKELLICEDLAPMLRRDGLIFVGIDLIQECLIEINVTSPTVVRQWNSLTGERMEKGMYEFLEKRLREKRN